MNEGILTHYGSWRLEESFELEGIAFPYRAKRKDKRGRLPTVKGNTPKIIKIGRGYSVTPNEKTVAAQKALEAILPAPRATLTGPVRVEIAFVFEPAPSWGKARRLRALAGLEPCVEANRGDLEQLCKLTNDALEARGYFANDRQVTSLACEKVYGERQGYSIRVYSLREPG